MEACDMAAALAFVPLACGCQNEPGAMRLILKSEKNVYQPNEPIRLTAELHTMKGPVCLTRGYKFSMALDTTDQGLQIIPADWAFCGTGLFAILPFVPLIQFASLLDVADVGHRYIVCRPGFVQTEDVMIIRETQSRRKDYALLLQNLGSDYKPEARAAWSPGEITITLTLSNPQSVGVLPAPLFWRPYSQRVSAKIVIRIDRPSSAPTTQQNGGRYPN